MPYQTDERLKSYLDTNQLHREQMCRALLSIDKRFTDVRPRHPRGDQMVGEILKQLSDKSKEHMVLSVSSTKPTTLTNRKKA